MAGARLSSKGYGQPFDGTPSGLRRSDKIWQVIFCSVHREVEWMYQIKKK